jgi:diguanylate cyclase (GGDEF)-like protein/PAS domain S-box-containing protein
MNSVARLWHRVQRQPLGGGPLYFAAAAFVFLVCMAFFISDGIDLVALRAKDLANARQDTANLARSLAQHAEDTFRGADISIIGVAHRLQLDGLGGLDQLRDIIAARLQMFPAVSNVFVIDSNGACILEGHPMPSGSCNFVDDASFIYHRTYDDSAPVLGAPVQRDPVTWIIPWSRRFTDKAGHFAGIVLADVSIGYLQNYYDTFDIGRRGSVLLAKTDGTLLVRRPFDANNIGRNLSSSSTFRLFTAGAAGGNTEGVSQTDGVTRLFSFRRVGNYPLVVAAAFARDEVLAPWRADAQSRVIRTGVMVVVIAALGTWLAFQVRAHYRLERAYRESSASFRLLAENSADVIVLLGPDLIRRYVSPACRQLLGYEPEELIGHTTDDIIYPDDRASWEAGVGPISADYEGDGQATYRVFRKDGTIIWFEVNRRALGGGTGFVQIAREVTERKEAEEQLATANRQLEEMANHDALTGLSNRRHFDAMLASELRRARRNRAHVSLVMIDVDHFKRFNDRYGHQAGDHCLAEIGRALAAVPGRPGDFAARYGGEEMALVLPSTPAAGALVIAERARQAVRALAIPHENNEGGIVTISLGVATTSGATDTPESLIEAADRALYSAKEGGRDRVASAQPAMRPQLAD